MKKLKNVLISLAAVSALMGGMVSCSHDGSDPIETITREFTQADFTADGKAPSSSWAYITYGLNEFVNKEITIDFSATIKAVNNTGASQHFKWQINNGDSFPEVAVFDLEPGESEVSVAGSNSTPVKINNGAVFYLSTNNNTYDLTMDISNIKYTVTAAGKSAGNKPAKEYPTNIFTVADTKIADFTEAKLFDGSQASNIVYNTDGTVTYTAKAAGSGGGVVFYIKDNKDDVINISNYESVDIELVCSPVTGSWNPKAKNPSFGFRVYSSDATGFWTSFADIDYFGFADSKEYGTIKTNLKITKEFTDKFIESCGNDDVMAFALKFNAYQSGNDDSDQLRVQLKKVQFNKKAGTPEDKPTSDGLTDEQRGTVKLINYPSQDYSVKKEGGAKVEYEKPAYVYLPAGYDADDKDTKYPVLILMHGYGQNWTTWGLTDQGKGGKIKGYMDRGMADGTVEKFICVVPTGVANSSWKTMTGNDAEAYYLFGEELRNDLLPYIEENFNARTDRDGHAMAGLSMGGFQTVNIGVGECLDLFSYFGAFSGALFEEPADFIAKVDKTEDFAGLKIHQFYMICGTADDLVYAKHPVYVNAFKNWDRIEKFDSEEVIGGTHDFPVWYKGFQSLIPLLFK